jgi:hypothetical protein
MAWHSALDNLSHRHRADLHALWEANFTPSRPREGVDADIDQDQRD